MMRDKKDVFHTVRETAKRLTVSEKTVRREIASGALEVVRIGPSGRSIRISDAALDRYLRDRT